jgi:UDP-N-acetylmuramyl pentapeptide phosphotransferase/UDP-N-acetylglucosamine-1-phosphate transferase
MDFFQTTNLLHYLVLAFVIIACIHLYIKVARQFGWKVLSTTLDSQNRPVVSGSGFIFPLSIFLIFLISEAVVFEPWMIGLICLTFLSWLDDFRNLPPIWRLLIHILCIATWLIGFPLPEMAWVWIVIVLFAGTGWMNAFNFMDGINGMMVMMSLVSLGTFYFVFGPGPLKVFIVSQIIAVLVFAYYNVRQKAMAFAGDVGSISLGFFLGYLMWQLVNTSERWEYILFFTVFAIDAGITILVRLFKKENILRAHEQHLYQILKKCFPDKVILISSVYAVYQMLLNIILIIFLRFELVSVTLIILIIVVNVLIYSYLRILFSKKMQGLAQKE